jgi:NIPSNAP
VIVEFRTYTIQPRTLPEFLKRFEDGLQHRKKHSDLAAFWFTEIGPLNQVVHVWPYENAGERERIRAEATKDGTWPPKTGEFIVDMKSEVLQPLPFSPVLAPADVGPYFEMRSYVIKPGGAPAMAERWKEYLPGRVKLSPLVGVFTSDVGALNQWIHIWAYKSLDQRLEIRNKAKVDGIWPPPGDSPVIRQETKIMLAAPFSPIK